MSREVRFVIEEITEQNHEKWENYFNRECLLWSDLSNLCNRVKIMGDTEKLCTVLREDYKDSLESVFGKGILDDPSRLQKAINFLKKMGVNDRIGEFYDPIQNARSHNKLSVVPNGFHIASCQINDIVAMSVLVVQSPDKQVQTHKFIFRSLGHLVQEAMEETPPLKALSLPLHDFAGKALGSHFVVTRPVHQMTTILKSSPEFKTFQSVDEEKRALGEANWEYMQQYGIGDLRYPMVYRAIAPLVRKLNTVFAKGGALGGLPQGKEDALFKKELTRLPMLINGKDFTQYRQEKNIPLSDMMTWDQLKPIGIAWLETAFPEEMPSDEKKKCAELLMQYYQQEVLISLPGYALGFAMYCSEDIFLVTTENFPSIALSYDAVEKKWKFDVKVDLQFQMILDSSLLTNRTDPQPPRAYSDKIPLHYQLQLTEHGFSFIDFECNDNETVKNAILLGQDKSSLEKIWTSYLFSVLKTEVLKFQTLYDRYRNGEIAWTPALYREFVEGATKLINYMKTFPGKYDLSGVDLSGVDLSGVDLSGVDLSDLDLSNTNCNGAIISTDTKLARAILSPDFFSVVKYQLTTAQISAINQTIERQGPDTSSFAQDNGRNNFAVRTATGTTSTFYEYLQSRDDMRQPGKTAKKVFQDHPQLQKNAICSAWLQSKLGVDETTAIKHMDAYKQGEVNFINQQMGDFYVGTLAALGAANIRLNLEMISTQYIKDSTDQLKLIQTFSPSFDDKSKLLDLDVDSYEILGKLGNLACTFVLNEAGQYVLESAQCDNYLLYRILMRPETVKQTEYVKIIFEVIKDHLWKSDSLLPREKIEKMMDIARRLKIPSVDFSRLNLLNVDLSALNLSNVNFSHANLTGADLTGANLTGANLTGAILKNTTFIDIIAKDVVLDRRAFLSRSVSPKLITEETSVSAQEVGEWKMAVEEQGGLHPSEISRVIEHLTVSAGSRGYYETTKIQSGVTTFGLFEKSTNAVVNIDRILHLRKEDLANKDSAHFIGITQFMMLIADLENMKKEISCIQMPMAITAMGRQHYVQLQIYKQADGGIGARIIDSTANPLGIPVDDVKALLEVNSNGLKAILNATSKTVTVSEVHTNEQLRPGDKKCGLYVVAGMKATADKVLRDGAQFLSNDSEVKSVVKPQHHVVSKTKAMNYLMGAVTVSAAALEQASTSSASSEESRHAVPSARPASAAADTDDNESLLLHENAEEADEYADAIQEDQRQQSSVAKAVTVYTKINDLLNGMDAGILKNTLEKVLKQYQQDRGFTINIFRRLSSAGKEYAAAALARLENASPEVARDIAREILFMAVNADKGVIELKHNSRAHQLLIVMVDNGLLTVGDVDLKNLSRRGGELKITDMTLPTSTTPRPS